MQWQWTPEHHVSEIKINNIVVFNLPPKSPASFPTTAAAKPRDTAEETDKDGNTLFHLEQDEPERMASQLEMVKRLYTSRLLK
jgi:hypothetical protein